MRRYLFDTGVAGDYIHRRRDVPARASVLTARGDRIGIEWPEGGEVVIELVQAEAAYGMREEDWPTTPEEVAALLRRWDEHELLEITSEEEAKWEEIRRTERELEKATFDEDACE
jgi:hypothetical protein